MAMSQSNDIDLEPDMAALTLSNPTKPECVDITKLPISGPNAPGASSKPLRSFNVRAPADPLMKRKKPVVRRTLEEFAARNPSNDQQNQEASISSSSTAEANDFSFSKTPKDQVGKPVVDLFPNLTNPVPYASPSYKHRDILAANPKPLTHCKDKEVNDKCHACILHDFKIADARLKENKIRLTDAELIVNSRSSKAEDKLKKLSIEWEGERNLFKQQMDVAIEEGIKKAKKVWQKGFVSAEKYLEMKDGMETEYNKLQELLREARGEKLQPL